jgi:hypothetical protein
MIDGLQPSDRIKDGIKDQLAQCLRDLPPEVQQNSKKLLEATRSSVHRVDHFETARETVRARMPLFVVVGSSYKSVKEPGPGAIASLDQNSASFDHLLQLIAERASVIGQESASDERLFLRKLNEELSAVQPRSMMMRLDKSAGGILLKNDKLTSKASDGPLFSLRQMQAKACLAISFSRIVYNTEAILMFDEPERGFPEALHKDLIDFIMHISKFSQCLYTYSQSDIFPKDIAARQYTADDLNMVAVEDSSL